MKVSVTIHHDNTCTKIEADEGAPIKNYLYSLNLTQPCGGNGKCGKCIIFANSKATKKELSMLGEKAVAQGLRLACYTKAKKGLEIIMPNKKLISVLTDFTHISYNYDPRIKQKEIFVEKASLQDQRPDLQRLLDSSFSKTHSLSFERLAELPEFLRTAENKYCTFEKTHLYNFSYEKQKHIFIADIGTTTVAAMLYNVETKQIEAVKGEQNAQTAWGADVISRIRYAAENNIAPLTDAIRNQLNSIFKKLMAEIKINDVMAMAITGNTTMLHLVCKIPPKYISMSPFIPVFTNELQDCAKNFGIDSNAPLFVMPCISSYVGGDIVAAMLAADAHKKQKPFLLIDLGTNAETVLGLNDKFYACSAAAGPCFEGANLSCGMPGQSGAVDSVRIINGEIRHTTINNEEAKGICGSGILDAVSVLLQLGNIDHTGKLKFNNTAADKKIIREGKFLSFKLTENVKITQQDIREIQLAKSAVCAGIKILLQEAGITANDIHTLYLAGGFGSALKAESAVRIGLFPNILQEKCYVLGNAASFGALRFMTEKNALQHVQKIIDNTEYIELSAHAAFSSAYLDEMKFPKL